MQWLRDMNIVGCWVMAGRGDIQCADIALSFNVHICFYSHPFDLLILLKWLAGAITADTLWFAKPTASSSSTTSPIIRFVPLKTTQITWSEQYGIHLGKTHPIHTSSRSQLTYNHNNNSEYQYITPKCVINSHYISFYSQNQSWIQNRTQTP